MVLPKWPEAEGGSAPRSARHGADLGLTKVRCATRGRGAPTGAAGLKGGPAAGGAACSRGEGRGRRTRRPNAPTGGPAGRVAAVAPRGRLGEEGSEGWGGA